MYLIFQKFFLILWRAWFYILASIPVLILFPILASLCFLKKGYNGIFWIARYIWSPFVLFGCGFYLRIKYKKPFPKNISHILVSNHTSYLDPFIMFRVSKTPFVFVGKKELDKIPVFGYFYSKVCILVDRDDSRSRKDVYEKSIKRLERGVSICIFPEGGVPEPGVVLREFKNGAFNLAIQFQIPIVPLSFYDCERRFPYFFAYNYFVGGPGKLRARFHDFIETKGLKENDRDMLKNKVYKLLKEDLAKTYQS